MTGETLTIVFVGQNGHGRTEETQDTESTNKTGHHKVSGMDVGKSQESCTVPVSVPPVNTSPRARAWRPLKTFQSVTKTRSP